MGWLFHNEKLRHQTPVAYITKHFSFDGETAKATVLAAAAVRGTIYAAIRNEDKTTGKAYVFCGVFLFKNNNRDGFGYKDMCESMGPCAVDCPDRIMRLLSPVADIPNPGYTADWRERVAAWKQRAAERRTRRKNLRAGAVLTLKHPVTFPGGIVSSAFRMVFRRRRTPVFEPVGCPGFWCRLSAATLETATVTYPDAADTTTQAGD